MVYSLRCQTPPSPVTKSLKVFDTQQREKLENVFGTVLSEESWSQATLHITLSGLGVRQCQDQYKASYVGSVLSSEDLVSKLTGESFSGSLFQYSTTGHFKPFAKDDAACS